MRDFEPLQRHLLLKLYFNFFFITAVSPLGGELLVLLAYLCRERGGLQCGGPSGVGVGADLVPGSHPCLDGPENWVNLGILPRARRTLSVLGWGTAVLCGA